MFLTTQCLFYAFYWYTMNEQVSDDSCESVEYIWLFKPSYYNYIFEDVRGKFHTRDVLVSE